MSKGYEVLVRGCGNCVCRSCLMWWSQRCPYGGCWDNYRAKEEPWPGPLRKTWSGWNLPGEQLYWCRGGAFYPTCECNHYIEYDSSKTLVKTCLFENVLVFQDGYILCGLVNVLGCEEYYQRFEECLEQE